MAGRVPTFANHVEASEALDRTFVGTRRIRSWDASTIELQLASDAEMLAKLVWPREQTFVDALPRGLAHGDFWDDNVLFRNGEVVFVTDFDFMGFRPRIDDLALTLFFTCMEFFELPVSDDQPGRLSTLVDAYDAGAKDHRLTRTEREALPFAIARQPLWSIGVWVASLDDETAARRHAATMPTEVQWALRLMSEAEKWQAAFS
jgi:Ser/Thr protein kinase RdoA (MazF antagonist)